MFAIIRRRPESNITASSPVSDDVPKVAVILVAFVLFSGATVADQRVPLTLAEAEDLALQEEPGVSELRATADALMERSVAAGQLPDPTVRFGLANYPVSGGSFSTEAMTQAQLGFRQAFPRGKLRAKNTEHFRALASVQNEIAAARSRDVLAATRAAWLEVYYWQRAEEILTESRPLFVDLLDTSQSLYGVGRKTQSDVLRAELELSRLDERLINAARSRSVAEAALSQWLGDAASRPVARTLPNWSDLPTHEDLKESLQQHPSMLAAGSKIDAQQASVAVAEEKRKPGWALDVGYGYREGFLPSGEPRSDFVSVSVVVDLPLFKKNRQDRSLAAALSDRSAAVSAKRRIVADLSSRLNAEYSRWTEIGRRLELFESRILDLTDGRADAAMLAYQSDTGNFSDVVMGQIDKLNISLDYIRLQVDRAQSYATLANLGGIPR